jgi:HPt (histidine-containing phosphotransfer) domain-containing protein
MTLATPSKERETSVVDRAAALDLVGGDEELLREIIGIFFEEYPKLIEGISEAVQNQDSRALERFAHNLKGSVSNFGAQSATQAALDLEMMGRKGDIQRAPSVVKVLEGELVSLCSALNDLQR